MKQLTFITSALLIMTLISCEKDNSSDDSTPPVTTTGIYVAYSTGDQHFDRIANYWHDGTNTLLLDRTSKVYINDMAVSANGNVYTSGCECTWSRYPLSPNQKDDSCKVTLWTNQVRQQLTQVPFSSITKAYLFVSNSGDVYVAGTENDSVAGIIRLWKNGIPSYITDGSTDANTRSLYVDGNDVYIGGSEKPIGAINTTATLWKNGVPQPLSASTSYFDAVHSIQVSGGDVYATVQESTEGFVVKNGVKLSQPSGIKDIKNLIIEGNDIYVLGKPGITTTSVWKNGVLLHDLVYNGISDYYDGGQKMFVKDGDVYVSGSTEVNGNTNIVLWKNGAIIQTIATIPGFTLNTAEGLVVK